MCEVIEQFVKEREHEAVLKLLFEGVQDGGFKIAYAAKKSIIDAYTRQTGNKVTKAYATMALFTDAVSKL